MPNGGSGSEQSSRRVAGYTRRARRSATRDNYQPSLGRRVGQRFEGVLRRVLYGLLGLLLKNRPLTDKRELSDVKSILIIPYGDAIGDLVVASGLWRAIKRRNPHCRIGVITSARNSSLVSRDPDVDVTFEFTGRSDLGGFGNVRRARRERFEVIVNVHSSHQTDYGLLANYINRRAVKATLNHPRRDLYQLLFNVIGSTPRHSLHISHESLELLAETVNASPEFTLNESWPALAIAVEARQSVQRQLTAMGVTGRYVVVHLQAATPFREWGIENTLELGRHIRLHEPQVHILLTASPTYVEAIPSGLPSGVHHFQNSRDLIEMAALLEGAALVVTPDTSVVHCCSAVRTACLTLFPDRRALPAEWLPVGVPSRILAPATSGDAVRTISVTEVYHAAVSLLTGEWTQTQTTLDPSEPQHPAYQASNALLPLSTFTYRPF